MQKHVERVRKTLKKIQDVSGSRKIPQTRCLQKQNLCREIHTGRGHCIIVHIRELDNRYHAVMLELSTYRVKYQSSRRITFSYLKRKCCRLAIRFAFILRLGVTWHHCDDVIMTTMASQITSPTVVYSTVYSDADQRKHQSSASLAFVWGIHRDRWIPCTKGQLRGKCFHLMTSSWHCNERYLQPNVERYLQPNVAYLSRLPWIFPGAPLKMNEAPWNIHGSLTDPRSAKCDWQGNHDMVYILFIIQVIKIINIIAPFRQHSHVVLTLTTEFTWCRGTGYNFMKHKWYISILPTHQNHRYCYMSRIVLFCRIILAAHATLPMVTDTFDKSQLNHLFPWLFKQNGGGGGIQYKDIILQV